MRVGPGKNHLCTPYCGGLLLAAWIRWTEGSGTMRGRAVRGVAAADEPSPRSTGHRAAVQRAAQNAIFRYFAVFLGGPRQGQRGAQAGVADAHRDRGVGPLDGAARHMRSVAGSSCGSWPRCCRMKV